MSSGCLFCRILDKKVPSKKIYEDELCYAFEDINPQAPVHALVIPKKHISTTLDLVEEDNVILGRLFATANLIAKEKGVDQMGFRLVMNTNPESGQSVYHIHLHVLGGRHMHWPPG